MANLFFTGFNGSTVVTDFMDTTGFGGIISSTYGRHGNGLGGVYFESGFRFLKSLPSANTGVVVVGMEAHVTLFSNERPWLTAMDSGGTTHGEISIDENGTLRLYRGTYAGTLLATSAVGVMPNDTWKTVEWRIQVDDTTGVSEVRVDNVVVMTFSGDTRNGGTANVSKFQWDYNNYLQTWLDNLYINDDTGAAPHNTYYGGVRVDRVETAANSSVQFRPTGGGSNNETMIDDGETGTDATTYNQSITAGHRDLFTLSAPSGVGTILGVQVAAMARKLDTGTRTLRPVMVQGSASLLGTASALAVTTGVQRVATSVDPATSAAFADVSAVGSLLVGYEVVT